MQHRKKFRLPAIVFLLVLFLLVPVQLKVERPMLLLERFVSGGGWVQMFFIAAYGALVAYKMQDPKKVQSWRKYTWFAFSVVFFSHSHLCYFGAVDSLSSRGKTKKGAIRNKWALKSTVILLVVAGALAMRLLGVSVLNATWIALGFGIIGLGIILLISRREGRMVHCTAYCPVGTVVNLTRFVNPFRMYIDNSSCTDCMACTRVCKYDALNRSDVAARKPGLTCTLCGDCLSSCHAGSLKYRFLKLSPTAARNLFLIISISLHAATMALARI